MDLEKIRPGGVEWGGYFFLMTNRTFISCYYIKAFVQIIGKVYFIFRKLSMKCDPFPFNKGK